MAQVKNFARVTVLAGHNTTDTSIALQTGQGAVLPSTAPFNVVWWNSTDYTDPSQDPNVEIVRVTNISTDTLTVTRAQESTTATTKNTTGKTYQMIAGLTAKGPETMGFGAGASPPAYPVDVRGGTAGAGQIHITDHDADDAAYIVGVHGAGGVIIMSQGVYYNGTNYVAKETSASMMLLQSGPSKCVLFYFDSGLTVGNTYTPTERARIDISGNLGLLGIGAPNVSLDTSGALATRFLPVTLANGLNSNINIGAAGNIRASGPTLAYSLGGFTGGFDGRELFFYNPDAVVVTIVNGDASSSAANRIQTNTGANVVLTSGTATAEFKYDSTSSLWLLKNTQS